MRGIHFEEVDEVTIHGESSHLILDGETFRAERWQPDPPLPRAAAVLRQAGRVSSIRCPNCATWSRRSWALPVDPRISAMAAAIAARHGAASRAVLFYGSCLRQKQLEGLMLDFYLIVSDYRAAYAKTLAGGCEPADPA